MSKMFVFNWSELAFESKKPLKNLNAIFLSAPRDISISRFTQLVKEHLPDNNLLIGISNEDYVDGLEDQPQFKMLKQSKIQSVIDKVNNSSSINKIYILTYFQRDLVTIIEKLKPQKVLFINGSWHFSFHTLPIYYSLNKNEIKYSLLPAFLDEKEALEYEKTINKDIKPFKVTGKFQTDFEAMDAVSIISRSSFDNGFQTGALLAKHTKNGYEFINSGFNKVVPYQTNAFLNGASREINLSPSNDLNHYDTIHAEMSLLVDAQKNKLDIRGSTLFINLMPCPTCARTLSETDIAEVVYANDHSNGYAVGLFEKSGKTVRRIV
jgi:deoxycytidylate deaminase